MVSLAEARAALTAQLQRLGNTALSILRWLGQESNRRMVTGVIIGGAGYSPHKELNDQFVDGVLFVVISALLAKWSSKHPKIEDEDAR